MKQGKINITTLLFTFVLLIGLLHPWHYDYLSKRRMITITAPTGTDITDVQVLLSIPWDDDMQLDYDDLRFTYVNSSGDEEEMPYWIEENNSSEAKVWVLIPRLQENTELYVYYGNDSISSDENPDSVFLFFDDFDSNGLDTNKWTTAKGSAGNDPGNYMVNDSKLILWGDWGSCCSGVCYYAAVRTIDKFLLPVVVDISFQQDPYNPSSNCGRTGPAILYGNNAEFIVSTSTADNSIAYRINDFSSGESNNPFQNKVNRVSVQFNLSGIYARVSWDSYVHKFEKQIVYNTDGWIGLAGDTEDTNIRDEVYFILVRKPYPDITVSIGEEENQFSQHVDIHITYPEDDSFVTSPVSIRITVDSSTNVTVYVYGDDNQIYSTNATNGTTNLSITWNAEVGSHEIRAEVYGSSASDSDTVSFTVLPKESGGGGGSVSINYDRLAREVWEYPNRTLSDLDLIAQLVNDTYNLVSDQMNDSTDQIMLSILDEIVKYLSVMDDEIHEINQSVKDVNNDLLRTSTQMDQRITTVNTRISHIEDSISTLNDTISLLKDEVNENTRKVKEVHDSQRIVSYAVGLAVVSNLIIIYGLFKTKVFSK